MAKNFKPSPPKSTHDYPQSDEQLVIRNILQKRINAFNEHRRSRMISIKANAAYLCGHQNIQVTNNTIVPLNEDYATPVVCNLILPAVINDIAVSMKVPPVFDVVPASTDEDDTSTAKACAKILPYLLRINDRNLFRSSVVLWYDLDGVGWRKVFWNNNHKVKGYEGEGDNKTPVWQGEVQVEHVPNTELVYDFRTKDLNKLEWIIHAKTVTMGFIRMHFGDDVAIAASQSGGTSNLNAEDEFEVMIMNQLPEIGASIAPTQATPGNDMLDEDKTAAYYEYWHKPTPTLPQGAYVIMVNDIIVKMQPFPIEAYTHGELPIIPASPIPINGILVGSIPRISQARPLQREYNKLRSIILDNIDAMGNSVLMAQKGSNVIYKRLSNTAGNIIEYEGPGKPSREGGVPIPGSIFAYMTEVKRGIEEIFAFHEPSKGIMPRGGPKSAKGLEVLQAGDYTQLGPMIEELELADEKVVTQMLALAVANYKEEKLIQIIGDDEKWVTARINPEQLTGKINVIVRRGSSAPFSKQQAEMKAFEAWSSGLLGDPGDPQVRIHTLKQMDLGNIDHIVQEYAKDRNFAQNEYFKAETVARNLPDPELTDLAELQMFLLQNLYVPTPNGFDNHQIHLHEHRNFVLDNYWKYMAEENPAFPYLMQAFIMHMDVHSQLLQQSSQQSSVAQTEAEAYTKGNTIQQLLIKKPEPSESHKKKS